MTTTAPDLAARKQGEPIRISNMTVGAYLNPLGECRIYAEGGSIPLTDAHALCAAIATLAAEAGQPAPGVAVKPLVWHNFDAWTWWAESITGTYRVEERNGWWRATLNLPQTEHIIYEYDTDGLTPNDFEAAILAAQADYAARIRSALVPAPRDPATVALVDRLLSELEAATGRSHDAVMVAASEWRGK